MIHLKKKRLTKKPKVIQNMEKCATDNNLDTKLEYMTVSCGFRRATAISSKYITDKELVNINRHRRKHKSLKSNRKNKKNILTPHQSTLKDVSVNVYLLM